MNKPIRILMAEPEANFVEMIQDSLQVLSDPYQIETVSSGEECLKKLQEGHFDLLLLDQFLSDGGGLEWLRRFNALGIVIPTIFVTAQGDSKVALDAMKEGVFDYINRSPECAKTFPFVVNRALKGFHLMLEKVRLQKELIETKNFLESIVEKAGDAISVVDIEGRVLYWNEGAERIYGYQKEEILGQKVSEFLYPKDRKLREEEEELMKELMARVLQGEVIPNVEARRQTKDGREIITNMTLSPIRDAEGRIIGMTRICKDVTQMKRAEERLLLTERLTSLGELTAGVAHELRNPLAGIKINTQILLRKKDLSETERRLLESIEEGIEKIQKIVEEMLHFAKPKRAEFREAQINSVVEDSLNIFQTKLKKANISLEFFRGENLPNIWIDTYQIQQVLINLMLNAIQSMEKGGRLTIRTFKEGEKVAVEVRDTGVGISPSHLKRIFDPFFTTKSEGTGLGLSITLKIIETHGGTIDVKSEEGVGTTFTIYLPLRKINAVQNIGH